MSYTATSTLGIVYQKIMTMLAQSETFQSETGSADAVEALTKIHFGENEELYTNEEKPFAVVLTDLPHSKRILSGGAQNSLWPHGTVELYLVSELAEDKLETVDFFGKVFDEICDQSGEDDELELPNAEMDWEESPEQYRSSFHFLYAAMRFTYGIA